MFKAVIFDYDGVIIDSFEYHLREYQRMFPEAGLTAEELARVHEGNFHERNNEVWEKIDVSKYDTFLLESIPTAQLLTPGMKELLGHISGEMYIVSSGPEGPINEVLRTEGIASYFEGVYGKETEHSKVVKLQNILDNGYSTNDVVFVTDTLGDVLEANKVGLRSVAVTYGFHSRETLERGKPWKIVDSVSQLEKVLL